MSFQATHIMMLVDILGKLKFMEQPVNGPEQVPPQMAKGRESDETLEEEGEVEEGLGEVGSEKGYWPWIKAIVSWGELGAGLTRIDLRGVYGLSGGTIDPALPASVTSLENMFRDWVSETIPDITGLVTSSVITMEAMFHRAYAFDQPIGSWNTSAVTNMSGMFGTCIYL